MLDMVTSYEIDRGLLLAGIIMQANTPIEGWGKCSESILVYCLCAYTLSKAEKAYGGILKWPTNTMHRVMADSMPLSIYCPLI